MIDLVMTGYHTTIAQALLQILSDVRENNDHELPYPENIFRLSMHEMMEAAKDDDCSEKVLYGGHHAADNVPLDADRYVFAHGYMIDRSIGKQMSSEIAMSVMANLSSTVLMCERILAVNSGARIAVMGSMSGIEGSYDTTYALAKAGLHKYVEVRRVGPSQQLVAIAPTIIWDSGMTRRRNDLAEVLKRAQTWPKKRCVSAKEVARLIYFLLWQDLGYITNCVIPMDGGNRATMKGSGP